MGLSIADAVARLAVMYFRRPGMVDSTAAKMRLSRFRGLLEEVRIMLEELWVGRSCYGFKRNFMVYRE